MRVLVAEARPWRRVETFVRAHVEHLPARVRLLCGPRLDTDDEGRLSVGAFALALAAAAVRRTAGERAAQALQTRRLARLLQALRVDAVLAEFAHTGTLMMNACARAGVPLVVHFHGGDAYNRDYLRAFGRHYGRLFDAAAAIVVVSHHMAEQLAALGAPPQKLHWSPCGADCAQFTPSDPSAGPPHFVSVSRFMPMKGPGYTLRAFRKVLDACPEARLTMAGGGPLRAACLQFMQQLGLGAAVEFPGRLRHAEVAAVLRGARAFVQHSVQAPNGDAEGSPVAIMEAGAGGLPVVATRHMGIKEIVVDGETGLLVDEKDVDGMAEAMIALARDPRLAARLGRAARERISEHFSLEARISRLWAIIRSVLPPSPARAPAARRSEPGRDGAGPLVSVVIPVYNAETYVAEAVRSVLGRPRDVEVILVEDGSRDGSLDVCRELAARHAEVRLHRHPGGQNRGAAASRNLGLRCAAGKYVAFLDADDLYLPNRFRLDIDMMEGDPTIEGVYGAVGTQFDEGYVPMPGGDRDLTTLDGPVAPEQLFATLLAGARGSFCTPGITLRRGAFEKAGPFDEGLVLTEDSAMWLRLSATCKLMPGSIGQPIALRRRHAGNDTSVDNPHWPGAGCAYVWSVLKWGLARGLGPRKVAQLRRALAVTMVGRRQGSRVPGGVDRVVGRALKYGFAYLPVLPELGCVLVRKLLGRPLADTPGRENG